MYHMQVNQIIPTAEPFFLPGGSTGCLLIHGFTGTPKEMRWMGNYLSDHGYTVLAPRLAGHATKLEDMNRVQWMDWVLSVEEGWHILNGICKRIFIAGISMGGVLSLLFASKFPVAGVIAMSTPYELPPDPRLRFIKLLRFFLPAHGKGPPDWHDPEPEKDHIDYPAYPIPGIVQLDDLLAELRTALPKITAPVLLIHSRQDQGVEPSNMEKIYESLTTSSKATFWVEDSGHVIIRDSERERVFQATHDFIRRTLGEAG
jgi:carboxylesterase